MAGMHSALTLNDDLKTNKKREAFIKYARSR